MAPVRDTPEPSVAAHPAGADGIYQQVRAAAGTVAARPAPVIVDEVAPGVVRASVATPTLPPATHTGCYLVGRSDLLAVDPGSPYPDQQAALAAEVGGRGRLAAIVLTHHHGDHVGGAVALAAATGAPIMAHADAAARLAGRIEVDRYLSDGDRLDLGGRRLEALVLPGHAPGHLALVDLDSRAAIVGDLVAGVGTILIDPDDGDMASYLASLARLRDHGVGALLPAHGPVIADGPARLGEYIAHRLMREARVLAALADEPRSQDEVCAVAYADTPRWLWPLAVRSTLAHLDKLVADGRAAVTADGWRRGAASGV